MVDRGVLCCMCGAFSDKWFDVAKRCGKNAEPLQVEWGKHIDPKDLDRQLATGKFDTVTLTHSETSTGVMNPLPEICCVLAKYPDVALIVDTVSSFSARENRHGRARDRRNAHRSAKSARAAAGVFIVLRFGKGVCTRRERYRIADFISIFSSSRASRLNS